MAEKLVAPLACWVWLSFVNLRSAVGRVFQAVGRVFQAAGSPSPVRLSGMGVRHVRKVDIGLWHSPVSVLSVVGVVVVADGRDPKVPLFEYKALA